jgi:hypothetical protein
LAAWKNIRPYDLTHFNENNNGKRWMLCTKCKDFVTGKKVIFNLSHFESNHKDNFRRTTPAATEPPPLTPAAPGCNLTMVHEYIYHMSTGPSLIAVLEPTDDIDLHEITFTSAWCFPVSNALECVVPVTTILKPEKMDDTSFLTGMSSGPLGQLITRVDDSSRDDSDMDHDNINYYPSVIYGQTLQKDYKK